MKKLLFLIPFFLLNCNKKETVSHTAGDKDSIITIKYPSPGKTTDSLKNGVVTATDLTKKDIKIYKNSRAVIGDSIIETIDAETLPLTISDEFTTESQRLTLKIKNFKGKKIEGIITPKNQNMNIRFNQIKFPNGDFDGPFGLKISEDITENGEVWLLIGKNLMASGNIKGKFSISLK